MGIEANCRKCGRQYTVPDSWAGKHVQCPRCTAPVEIATPVVDIVVTGDDVPSPFIDPLEETNPFAQSPALTDSGPWKVEAENQPPNPLQKPMSKPGSNLSTKLLQGNALMIATGIGMGLVLVWALVVGIRVGFSFWLLPHALLLAAGATILVGGMSSKPAHRNQAKIKGRTLRIAAWFAGGLGCAGAAFVAMVIVARTGVPVPSVVMVGTPFLLVPLGVSFLASMLLAYNVLVLLLPKSNVFRAATIGYVVLTVVVPGVMIPVGILGRIANQAQAPQEPPEGTGDQLAKLQPSPPSSPPPTVRPQPSRDATVPAQRGGSTNDRSNAAGLGRRGRPGASPLGSAMGARERFSGRPTPGSNMPGSGFRGPPSARPGGGAIGSRPNIPSFESSVARLVSRFGATRVVTVQAEPVEGSQFKEFTESIRTAANAERAGQAASLSNGMLRVAVGPVNDIQAFAERLDIGEVVDVDQAGQKITVEVRRP